MLDWPARIKIFNGFDDETELKVVNTRTPTARRPYEEDAFRNIILLLSRRIIIAV